ncbi:hypothetical protein FQZ97_754880 [compost metagenome]
MRPRNQPQDHAFPGNRLRRLARDEHPFNARFGSGSGAQRAGGEKEVVTTAGVDRVVQQRLALDVQRHAPDQTIQLARQQIKRSSPWPLRKPGQVNQLHQRVPFMPNKRDAPVHRRLRRVHTRRAIGRQGHGADAVEAGPRGQFKHRGMAVQQLLLEAFTQLGNAQRVARCTRERITKVPDLRCPRHEARGGWPAGRHLRLTGKGVQRVLLPALHARAERQARDGVDTQRTGQCGIGVRDLRPFKQPRAAHGRASVKVCQHLRAVPGLLGNGGPWILRRAVDPALGNRSQGINAHVGQVGDFNPVSFGSPRLQQTEPVVESRTALRSPLTKRGQKAGAPQLREPHHAVILSVVHPVLGHDKVQPGEPGPATGCRIIRLARRGF